MLAKHAVDFLHEHILKQTNQSLTLLTCHLQYVGNLAITRFWYSTQAYVL